MMLTFISGCQYYVFFMFISPPKTKTSINNLKNMAELNKNERGDRVRGSMQEI